jgi:hypothetical protein
MPPDQPLLILSLECRRCSANQAVDQGLDRHERSEPGEQTQQASLIGATPKRELHGTSAHGARERV